MNNCKQEVRRRVRKWVYDFQALLRSHRHTHTDTHTKLFELCTVAWVLLNHKTRQSVGIRGDPATPWSRKPPAVHWRGLLRAVEASGSGSR